MATIQKFIHSCVYYIPHRKKGLKGNYVNIDWLSTYSQGSQVCLNAHGRIDVHFSFRDKLKLILIPGVRMSFLQPFAHQSDHSRIAPEEGQPQIRTSISSTAHNHAILIYNA